MAALDTLFPLAGPQGNPRDAVHLLYADEKVTPDDIAPSAKIGEVEQADDYDVLTINVLVEMKLNSYRRKAQVHLLDLLDSGLVDATWLPSLLPEHTQRLQQLIDDPNGCAKQTSCEIREARTFHS